MPVKLTLTKLVAGYYEQAKSAIANPEGKCDVAQKSKSGVDVDVPNRDNCCGADRYMGFRSVKYWGG